MTETDRAPAAGTGRDGFLDPTTRAVAALALAVVGLMGSNVLTAGVQVLLQNGAASVDSTTYLVAMAVASALPFGLALWLALAPIRVAGWAGSLARAAALVAGVGLLGSVTLLLGALLGGGL